MGKLLAAAAMLVGLYALWVGQTPGAAPRIKMPGALIAPTGTPGTSVGAAAVGVAARAGN